MNIEEFARKAITVPFVPHGRGWKGWDCWGLMYMAYKEVRGIGLPRYDKDYQSVKDRALLEALFAHGIESQWKTVTEAQACDGIMYRMNGNVCHVGLAVNDKKMIHTEHGIGTTYENIKTYNVEGIYRYVE